MRIDSDAIREQLRSLAIEQAAERLEREGYTVEKRVRLGTIEADLRAVAPGGEERIYHFLVPRAEGRAQASARVRAEARARGAAYHAMLARLPRDVDVEVVGIVGWLEDAFRTRPPENVARLAPRFGVVEVADVEIDRARVEPGRTELEGRGLVALDTPPDVVDLEAPEVGDHPFRFRVVLDSGGAHRVEELSVDLPPR